MKMREVSLQAAEDAYKASISKITGNLLTNLALAAAGTNITNENANALSYYRAGLQRCSDAYALGIKAITEMFPETP